MNEFEMHCIAYKVLSIFTFEVCRFCKCFVKTIFPLTVLLKLFICWHLNEFYKWTRFSFEVILGTLLNNEDCTWNHTKNRRWTFITSSKCCKDRVIICQGSENYFLRESSNFRVFALNPLEDEALNSKLVSQFLREKLENRVGKNFIRFFSHCDIVWIVWIVWRQNQLFEGIIFT